MVKYDYDSARPYTVTRTGYRPHAWSDIKCPFCQRESRAYSWSLAGGGKCCPCGAKHNFWGTTAPRVK
jgi:hypothetical protein